MEIRNKYVYPVLVIMAGYILLSFPCIFHTITGYPCPACGTRRALTSLLKGDIYTSVLINPYGLLFTLLAIFYIAGLASDFIRKNRQFRDWLNRSEHHLTNKYVLLPIVLLTILNWIWNIHKGL
ncbi:DUF2752 domain-containing protein [Parabacteroides faecis]|uniref:DUF2752 domain-containing protein n=1 Tax=Parabacteroides faecis TaxID=1217282 RepID=A0ABR6KWF3_9BACT|nr:DUF2752 domain-containing protein [Parabacteroides faecis]MBB4625123.1 hypothetical protein [Parabacteroides faecis]